MIDGAKQKLLLYLYIPLYSFIIIFSHTWYISLVPPTLYGIIISVADNLNIFKLNSNLNFIVKPSSDMYILTAAGRLRRGDLIMGPPLKAGEWWPPWVGDGGITHYLWTSSSPGGPFWVWKQTLKFLPSTLRFQDLILESSGRKANALAMSYWVLLLWLVEKYHQNKKISQSKNFTVIIIEYVDYSRVLLLLYLRTHIVLIPADDDRSWEALALMPGHFIPSDKIYIFKYANRWRNKTAQKPIICNVWNEIYLD